MAEDQISSIGKIGIPVTMAAAVVWIIASLVYGAGTKVASADKDNGYLTARVDTLEKERKEADQKILEEHDSNVEMRIKLVTLKEYVDSVEAGKNITVSMDPPAKRR